MENTASADLNLFLMPRVPSSSPVSPLLSTRKEAAVKSGLLMEPLATSTPRLLEPLSPSTHRLLEPLSATSTPRLLEPLSTSLDVAARYKKIKTKTGEGTRAYRSLRSNTSENLSAIPQVPIVRIYVFLNNL